MMNIVQDCTGVFLTAVWFMSTGLGAHIDLCQENDCRDPPGVCKFGFNGPWFEILPPGLAKYVSEKGWIYFCSTNPWIAYNKQSR